MRFENLVLISWQNVKRNRQRVFLSSLGIIFGIATLIFFFSLTDGARDLIFEHFLNKLPSNQLRVTPRIKTDLDKYLLRRALGIKSDYRSRDSSELIFQDEVDAMLTMEGVRAVHCLYKIEAVAYVYAFSARSRSNSMASVSAYEDSFMMDILPDGVDWTWKPGDEAVPVIANPQILIAYNEYFAANYDAPKIDSKTISKVPLFLLVRNPQTDEDIEFKLKVVGMSPQAPLAAPIAPLAFVRSVNESIYGEDFRKSYSSVIVVAESPAYVKILTDKFTELGYDVGGEQKVADSINTVINVITIFLTSISLIIVIIALINVFNIFLINVTERKFEIGVLRAVGAGRGAIRSVILMESAFIGLVNGTLGSILGFIAVLIGEAVFKPFLSTFIFTEFQFFSLNFWLIVVVIFASPLVNLIAVIQPANYAAKLDPVRALRK